MLSSRIRRHAAVAGLALALTLAATDAFAIRNRYTNEQNEGFAALFFEAFGHPAFDGAQPIARTDRRPSHRGAYRRSEDGGNEPWAY